MMETIKAGRELDKLVHTKVMGFSLDVVCDRIGGCLRERGRRHGHDSACKCDDMAPRVKRYSEDIAAAWQVVEKLADQNGEDFAVEIIRAKHNRWLVSFQAFGETEIMAIYDTLPLAICLAALKAVGEGVRERV